MASFKEELFSGVMYTAIAKYAGIIIQLVVAGVLGRLLSPEDFGTVAIVTVIISFFAIFCDIGIGPAVIQNKTLDKKELSDIFSFTIWSGVVLAFLFFCCSWKIASFYSDDRLILLSQLLSLYLLFTTFNIVPNALFYKNKRFGFVAGRTLVVQILSGVLGILAAYYGAGMYALLINPIISALAIFCINMTQYPMRVRLFFSIEPLKKIFTFSFFQFMFNILNYFTRNLDKLLIGRYLSSTQLGYYEKSYRLMMLPLQNIAFIVTPVMHPIFSEFQNDLKKLSDSYLKVTKILSFIGFPLSIFLFFSGREIMLLVFGGQWELSVLPFKILALTVGTQILLSTTGAIFQAANTTKLLFISGLLSALVNIGGIFLGVFVYKTLEAVSYCILATFTINFFQAFYLIFVTTLKTGLKDFFVQLIKPLILTAILGVVLFFVGGFTKDMNLLVSLIIKSAIAAVVFLAFIHLSGEINIFEKAKALKMKFLAKK